MSTKYTPGPWHVEPGRYVCNEDGHAIAVAVARTSLERGSDDYDSVEPVVADRNAHLIAKAPEMLEALRALGSLPIHTQGCNQMLTTEYFNAILLARAIINEIEGE